MSTNEEDRLSGRMDAIGRLLTLRGTCGRGWYLVGIGVELVILFLGLASLAGLNNPTGGGSIGGALFFPLIALLFHICLVTARMRDAGVAHPVLLGIIVGILPFAWVGFTVEFIESLWALILLGFVALYFGPLLAKSKAVPAAQS